MAIIKSLKSRVGIDISYHRVLATNINYNDKKIVICLASYVSLDSRVDKYDPLEVVDIEVPKEDFSLFSGVDTHEMSYLWLKDNIEGFDDALDDLEKREREINEQTETNEWWDNYDC